MTTGLLLIVLLLIVVIAVNYRSGIPVNHLIESYTYPESGFMDFQGMKVHYRITGSGPTLVLIHGVASSLHTWEGWHNILSEEFKVISFDVPGFGLSGPHPKGDYSLKMYMGLIDQLLVEQEVTSCFMAGNSFGGLLTWNYALHNPGGVKKIILIDAVGFNANRKITNPGFKLAMNPWTKWISHRITPFFLLRKSVEDVYGDKSLVDKITVKRYYDLILRQGNREAFSSILVFLHSNKIKPDKIKEVTQPTLIMWGSKDRVIHPADADQFHRAIKGSQKTVYEGVGHIPMEEHPQETAVEARKFLLS